MIPPMRGYTPEPEESLQRPNNRGSMRRSPNRKRKPDTMNGTSPSRKRKIKGKAKDSAPPDSQNHRDGEVNTVQSEPPARREDEGYIICLLLQKDKKRPRHYRRIGLTKVPAYDAESQRKLYDRDMSERDRAREREEFYLV
jgi:hypothetical protein